MERKSFIYWKIIAVLCGLAASSIGICINSVGVFYSPVSESLNFLRGTFALHSTFSTLTAAVVALFLPRLLNEKSYKKLIFLGVVLVVGTTALMGICKEIWQFLTLGVIRGLGMGFLGMVTLTTVINNWFVKMHGMATSIVMSFAGVAGAVCSPMFTMIIENFGWQAGFFVMAALLFVLCMPAVLINYTISPKTMGLTAYGETEQKITEVSAVQKTNRQEKTSFSLEVVCLILLSASITAVTGLPQHFPGYAETLQFSAATGGLMLSLSMIGNIVSKILIGVLSDWLGAIKSVIIILMINTGAMLLLIVNPSPMTVLVGAFLFGFVYSASSVGTALITRYCFGTDRYGKVYPYASFAINFGSAVAVSLIGYIYDFTGTYVTAYLVAIGMQAANVLFVLYLNKTRIKENEV